MRRLNAGFRAESFGPFAYLFEEIVCEKYEFDLKRMVALDYLLELDRNGFIDDLCPAIKRSGGGRSKCRSSKS